MSESMFRARMFPVIHRKHMPVRACDPKQPSDRRIFSELIWEGKSWDDFAADSS